MTSILDNIEQNGRLEHIKALSEAPKNLNFFRAFALSFFITPFIVAKLLFVPIFGHFVVILNFVLLYYYLKIKSSKKYTLTVFAGSVCSITLLVLLYGAYPRSFDLLTGSFMILATSIGMGLMVSLGMAIYRNTFPQKELPL